MAKITRTAKFEVYFPGYRKSDLIGNRKKKDGPVPLYKQLWQASEDLTLAANKAIGALFQVQLGSMEAPIYESGKNAGKSVHLRTLTYRCLSGDWQPFGEPMYKPTHRRLGSRVLVEAASMIFTRLQTDFFEVKTGQKSLPTFRKFPIGITGPSVEVFPDGRIVVPLWAREKGKKRSLKVTLKPKKIDRFQRSILDKCATGVYKTGSAKLSWYQPTGRKGRWMLSLSWTGEVQDRTMHQHPAIAGVHLGMTTAMSVAYGDLRTGKEKRKREEINLGDPILRQIERTKEERRKRSKTNAKEFNLRQGRGRQRKMRVASIFGDRVRRMTDTATSQAVAALVNKLKKNNVSVVALEDLQHWSRDRALDESELMSNKARKEHRKWYFRWHQGELRLKLKHVLEREGFTVYEVDAAYDSRSCYACGTTYPQPLEGEDGKIYGRYKWRRFRCLCGFEAHADRNASLNVMKRGLEVWADAQSKAAK